MAKRPGKTRASDAWGTESTPERTERIQFKVSTDEIAAIDEFRFQTRMPNRATAIRELLRRGLGFHPRQPELFCAAELFFSLLSGGGNGQAAWQNQGK
jgi:hypothetical protein